MKKIFLLLLFGGILSATGFGQKEKATMPLPGFSMGLETVFPTGDLNLISSMGMGVRMQTVTPFCPKAGVVFSGGVTYYSVTQEAKTYDARNFLAFTGEAGCRLFLPKGLYFEPKTGFTYFSGKGGSDVAFTYALNIGVKTSNYIDVSFGYENASLKGLNLSHTGVTVAYIFH